MYAYLKIKGIDGDVTIKGFEKSIEILSFDFSVKRQVNSFPGRLADRESSGPMVSELTLTKIMDKTTPILFSESVIGKTKPEIQLILTTSGDTPCAYMEYTLANAIISAYHVMKMPSDEILAATNNTSFPLETLLISFDKIEMKFTPYDEKHKPQSPIAASYSLADASAGG